MSTQAQTYRAAAVSHDTMTGEESNDTLILRGGFTGEAVVEAFNALQREEIGEEALGYALLGWFPEGADTAAFVIRSRSAGQKAYDTMTIAGVVYLAGEVIGVVEDEFDDAL